METGHLMILAFLLGCMATYVPVYLSLFFTAVIGFIFFTNMPILLLVQTIYRSMDNFALIIVLYFILCGNIMTAGETVKKLIKVANSLVSWVPGGLGMAGCLACGMFGAISGSTVATVVALGGFMIPQLLQHGYPEKYTLGLMTTSPNLGVIIPPSIAMILYCLISNVSLQGLFLTGFVPGIMIMLFVCIYSFVLLKNDKNIIRLPVPKLSDVLSVFKEGFWAIMLIVIIYGGIFSGVFTANEAAVVACVYAFIVELFIYRSISFAQARRITIDSAVTSASLLILVAGASTFGRMITLENIPEMLVELVTSTIQSPIMFLLVVNILLLIIGMFMDIISATMILGPVFLPMVVHYDINLMHFGLIMTVNLAIGYCTPPMGVSIFITSTISKRDFIYISKSVLPFLVIQIAVLMFITYMPDLVLWLPRVTGWLE